LASSRIVIDPYDDNFSSLKRFFINTSPPPFIKTASILTTEEHEALPDHTFAVIYSNYNKCGNPIRKYACLNKAHTAINVLYFMDCADRLPLSVKEKVANNLIKACDYFDLQSPKELYKIAQRTKVLIKGDGAEIMVPARKKESELSGTTLMPLTAVSKKTKTASFMDSPYVEVYGKDFIQKTAAYDPSICALDNTYPLVSYNHVIEARDHFEENWKSMHPRARHNYCIKLAARANQLGIPISEKIKEYGSRTYAPASKIKTALDVRNQLWKDSNDNASIKIASLLFQKRGMSNPDDYAEALATIDASSRIDKYWNTKVPDPWESTFGMRKIAEWTWSKGNYRIDENLLNKLVAEDKSNLEQRFGSDLVKELTKDPTSIFYSLPMDQKIIICNMARQTDSGI
jgi:hypothetical protein